MVFKTLRQSEVNLAYKSILDKSVINCPGPEIILNNKSTSKKGIDIRSKARNLLERPFNHQADVLSFMIAKLISDCKVV